MKRQFVVAITGASGAAYAKRFIEVLVCAGCDVHLTISTAGASVIEQELGFKVDLTQFDPSMLGLTESGSSRDPSLQRIRTLAGVGTDASSVLSFATNEPGMVRYHNVLDLMAPIASGSFMTDAMVVCPCSTGTLSAIAYGTSTNLIHRAAEVHLKERRPLILVPRETPLSAIHLDNMQRVQKAGAIILPAMPGFYHSPQTIQDLIDFVVARLADQLEVPHDLMRRWGS